MSSRRKSREHALQVLFLWDMRRLPVEESIAAYYGSLSSEEGEPTSLRDLFLTRLVSGTVENIADIDGRISQHAEHWRIERMPAVDRNILRLAIYEMIGTDTPAPVVIDEALELARRYSTEESVQFVNGVLDAVHRELERSGKMNQPATSSG